MDNYSSKRFDKDGNAYYYNANGELHRLDGPAIERANGDRFWYVNGKYLSEKEFNKHPLVFDFLVSKEIDEALRP